MSKALEKSSSTMSIWWGFSRVLVRSLIVVSSEVSQERLDLKPCCRSVRMLLLSRCLWIDVDMICSRIVHGILVREIGR